MKKLIVATNNKGKVVEIKKLISGYDVRSLADEGIIIDVVEDADNFAGNAKLKAVAVSKLTDCLVIADDSGICVDALDGEPGVYSARYAGENATDADNNALLIKNLQGKQDRSAKYVCVISLCKDGEQITAFAGHCNGIITTEPAGTGGFGYDPYFFMPSENATFAEIPLSRKNEISHRGEALRQLCEFLEESEL